MRLIDFLDQGAAGRGKADCLVEGGVSLSFDEVVALSNRIARALARDGFQAGDRVAVFSPNSALGFVCVLGLLRADGVLVSLNTRNSVADNLHVLAASGARWMFFHESVAAEAQQISQASKIPLRLIPVDAPALGLPGLTDWLEGVSDAAVVPSEPPRPDALWRLSSTGGTTGKPKLVEQPHISAQLQVATLLALFRYDQSPTYLMAAPMTHAAGILAFGHMAMGGRSVILPKVDPDAVLSAIQAFKVNCLFLPPSALYAMLANPAARSTDHSSLRYFLIGSSPVSPDRLAEAIEVFGPVIAQGYGQTEASTLLTFMPPDEYARALASPELRHRLRSCGRPTPFARVAVMDEEGRLLPADEPGEIVVRSAMLMRGYVDAPEETAAAQAHGWHHTGDVGVVDVDGFVSLLDRKRDLIISGGFNVFPSEVEQVVLSHGDVEDCAVVGVPDERWGEAVKAVVVLKNDARVTEEVLRAWCRERLGGVKAPKSIEFWPALPKSVVGKVLRRDVRQKFWIGHDRHI